MVLFCIVDVDFAEFFFFFVGRPSLKFSDDESICGHLVSNQVDFYQTPNFSKIAQSLKLPNVSNYVLSSGTPIKVAAFVPEKKGTPACVRLYRYPQLDQHVSSKSFFKAQDCKMMWNSKGSALLVLTHTDVDKTGKSYYGETGLYFMSSDGKLDLNVTLSISYPKKFVSNIFLKRKKGQFMMFVGVLQEDFLL